MTLYHVITNYQLLCAVVHKAKRPEEKAVLIISIWIEQKIRNLESLEAFFSKVIVMDAMITPGKDCYFAKKNCDDVDELLRKNGIQLSDFDEIHVAGATYKFGAYLVEKNIPYIYWEEAAGLLSRPSVLLNNESSNPEKQKYCKQQGLYDGKNDVVIKRICNISAQMDNFHDDLAENFDVTEELNKLSPEVRKAVFSAFTTVEKVDIPENTVLFLTQHFANLRIMSFEEQALIYQLIIDYFFSGQSISIKPHPDDLMYYSLLFPGSTIIHERFPSEFLPYMFANKPKTIATISSTGLFTLKPYFENYFSMDFKYQEHFKMIHRYYAAVRFAKTLGTSVEDVKMIGTDEKLVENLFRYMDVSSQGTCGAIYIVDDASSEEETYFQTIIDLAARLPENGVMIFINSREEFCFHDIDQKGIWNNIIPMCIQKRCIRNSEFFSDIDPEIIYVFSKNEGLCNMAEEFKFEKELKYTGVQVSLERMTPEQKRIKVLEGVLAATERRLMYYKEKAEASGGK